MKKRIIASILFIVLCVGLLAGCKEGWTKPEEPESGGDITLSGEMYSGKVVVSVVLHPDGTAECDANGKKSEGTWEKGTGDIAMVAHVDVKGEPVELQITEEDGVYSAPFDMVPGLTLTGK